MDSSSKGVLSPRPFLRGAFADVRTAVRFDGTARFFFALNFFAALDFFAAFFFVARFPVTFFPPAGLDFADFLPFFLVAIPKV